MSEGTVLTWHKAVGDAVTEDEPLAEIEAEKVEETLEAPGDRDAYGDPRRPRATRSRCAPPSPSSRP